MPDVATIRAMSIFHLLALKLALATFPTNLPLLFMFHVDQISTVLPQGWLEATLTAVK